MGILALLENNKGTVSSALGKELAAKVLDGETGILREAVGLAVFEPTNHARKSVRSGAAKIVEIVAERRPELVAPFLPRLLAPLSVKEPQTRWMIIRTMGFCAHLDPATARKAIPHAERYIANKEGLCLSSSADLFLGDLGALSKKDASRVFPLLRASMAAMVPNERDWLLESLCTVYPNLGAAERKEATAFARTHEHSERKSTGARARKLLGLGR
jgi:hypothetical protein